MTDARAVIATASLSLALALSGCAGDDPEPHVAPSSPTATTPSTSETPSPTEPTMPAAARGTDAAAAEAFVRFYWQMVNYAQATGDTQTLRSLGQRCATCDRGIDSIDAVYTAGGRIEGGKGSLSGFRTNFINGQQGLRAVVEFTLTNTKEAIDYPGDAKDKSFRGGHLHYQLLLQSAGGKWRVLFLGEQ